MVTLAIEDALNAELERVAAQKGRANSDVAAEALRQYVQTERRKEQAVNPALIALYSQLADEDVALAEAGMEDYHWRLIADSAPF